MRDQTDTERERQEHEFYGETGEDLAREQRRREAEDQEAEDERFERDNIAQGNYD